MMLLGAVKATAKVIGGGKKGTAKSLSASEAAAVSKEMFHQKQTNPAELQANISRGITEAVESNPVLKMKLDAINKAPYNSRSMETLLKGRYGENAVISTTMTDIGGKNVGLSGMGHAKTGIPFTEKGAPIFDSVAVCDLRIPREVALQNNDKLHKTAATRQLKADIEAGIVKKEFFTQEAFDAIKAEQATITGFIWHHHEDVGRMQLVPRWYHEKTGHDGGMKFWPFTDNIGNLK
jgi:hypothetical protein